MHSRDGFGFGAAKTKDNRFTMRFLLGQPLTRKPPETCGTRIAFSAEFAEKSMRWPDGLTVLIPFLILDWEIGRLVAGLAVCLKGLKRPENWGIIRNQWFPNGLGVMNLR
jgi:hypothetical protein